MTRAELGLMTSAKLGKRVGDAQCGGACKSQRFGEEGPIYIYSVNIPPYEPCGNKITEKGGGGE